jgi:hypothetical protein
MIANSTWTGDHHAPERFWELPQHQQIPLGVGYCVQIIVNRQSP